MRLSTSCHLEFDVTAPVPFVLMLRPRSGDGQWIIREEYQLEPMVEVHEFSDDFGNLCQRLTAPQGRFVVHTSAEVIAPDAMDIGLGAPLVPIPLLPAAMLKFLLPSRYCESEMFGQMAAELTAGQRPGYDQVAAISNWVRENVTYIPGSGAVAVSAVAINERRSGVCRDLAHLGIALCRALCIPARLVVGYLHQLEPMDLHAWFEAYVDHRWYTFDATQQVLRGGYVPIGFGRDAADVAVYNQFGPPVLPTTALVGVEQLPTLPSWLPLEAPED